MTMVTTTSITIATANTAIENYYCAITMLINFSY